MKIISNFKDFYDFNNIYDTDERLVYVRKTDEVTKENHTELIRKLTDSRINSYNSFSYKTKGVWYVIRELMIGVYPCVYHIPYLEIHREGLYSAYIGKIILTKDIYYDKVLLEKRIRDIVGDDFNYCPKLYYESKGKKYRAKSYLEKVWETEDNLWITENPEYFKELGAPTFVFELLSGYSQPVDRFVINPKVSDCVGAVDMIMKNGRDIYTDIENGLWFLKQEPIPTQTDIEKVVSHGFDKKTSFRKM